MDFLNSYAFEQMAREYHAKYNVAQALNKKDDEVKLKVKNNFEKICRLFCMIKNSFVKTLAKSNFARDCSESSYKKNRPSVENRSLFSNFSFLGRLKHIHNGTHEVFEEKISVGLREVFESFDEWTKEANVLFENGLNCECVEQKTTHKECAVIFIDLLNDYIYYIETINRQINAVNNSESKLFFEKSKQLYIYFFKIIKNFYRSI